MKNSSYKILKKGESIFLKKAELIPKEILEDMSTLFETEHNITAAYLAEGFLEAGEEPHYIIGVKLDDKTNVSLADIMKLLSKNIQDVIPKSLYVDFIEIDDRKTDINDFMKDYIIPFYTRVK